jgi:transglutaminase-like putative cysteine protease
MSGSVKITAMSALATVLSSLALLPAYDEPGWFWSGAVAVAFVSAIGFGLRQLGTPRVLVPLGQLAALGWAFILIFARDDLRLGFLPSGAAVQTFVDRINDGLSIVAQYAAPVPGDSDLTMVTTLGIGLVAVAVDALAATARLVPWAGLPLLLLYSIPATTVSGGLSALAFVPPAIGYVLLLTSEGRDRLSRWGRVIGFAEGASGQQEGVSTSLLGQTGRRVGIAVIGLAVIVPALIPALPEGVFGNGPGGDGGNGGGTIRVNNPIVDLKRDLDRTDDVNVFSYETDAKYNQLDYIRMVVLDNFNGIQWSPSQRRIVPLANGDIDAPLPSPPPGVSPGVGQTRVRTTFQLLPGMKPKWLPVIYPAATLRGKADWGYDRDTLDIVSREGLFEELTYTETSTAVSHTAEELAAVGDPPADITARYTALPGSVPESVRKLAMQIVQGEKTNYDKAAALQAWFRSEFTYDLTVRSGHGGSALMEFINDKRGYCEQFAATMAIMARSLDIPARVAIGYMPGERIGDNKYIVSAHDAHAWPELYFDGYGWVRFEPTPAQQTGSAPSWTLPESEATSTVDPGSTGNPDDDPLNRLPRNTSTPTASPIDPNHPDNLGGGTANSFNPLPFVIGGLALLLFLAPMTIRVLVRRSRLSGRSRPGGAEGGWRELAATVVDLRLEWDDAATPRAVGARFEQMLPRSASDALRRVVLAVEQLRYAPIQPDTPTFAADVREVSAALRGRAAPARRVVAFLLPPSLLRRLVVVFRPVTWVLDGVETLGPRLVRRFRRPRREPAAHRA